MPRAMDEADALWLSSGQIRPSSQSSHCLPQYDGGVPAPCPPNAEHPAVEYPTTGRISTGRPRSDCPADERPAEDQISGECSTHGAQWNVVWVIFFLAALLQIGIIEAGRHVAPVIAGADTRVYVGAQATVIVPEGWEIVPTSTTGFALARHDKQWIRIWATPIDHPLNNPDPVVTQRQIEKDRVLYAPDNLCAPDRLTTASTVALLPPSNSDTGQSAPDQPSSAQPSSAQPLSTQSVQLAVIACGCQDGCATNVAESLRIEAVAQ